MSYRDLAYRFLRVSNDVRAVQRGRLLQRLWNRFVGRLTRGLFR